MTTKDDLAGETMSHLTVHHNSRHADGTLSDNQTGLKPYEVRVYIGSRGANVLHIGKDTHEIVVHKDNVTSFKTQSKEYHE